MKYLFPKYDVVFLPLDGLTCIDHAGFAIMNDKLLFKEEVRLDKQTKVIFEI